MAKDMYQKRKERKNKPEVKDIRKTNINWATRIFGNPT